MSERVWKTLLIISLIAYLWKFSQRWSRLFNWMQKLLNDFWLMACRLIGTSFFRMPPRDMPYQVCIISSIWGWAQGHFNSCQEILLSPPSRKPEPTFDLLEKKHTKASNLSQPTPAPSSKISSSECLAHLIPEDLRRLAEKDNLFLGKNKILTLPLIFFFGAGGKLRYYSQKGTKRGPVT